MKAARDWALSHHQSTLWIVVTLCITVAGCATPHSTLYQSSCDTAAASVESAIDSSHVHVYFVHGLDPLDVGNLAKGIRYCRESGFDQVELLQCYEGDKVIQKVSAARAEDPKSRFLIFGYSCGAATTRYVAEALHTNYGIDIDSIFYISGVMLPDTPYSRPDYVGKIIHILEVETILSGTELTGAENYRLTDAWHFGTPTHPETLALLQRELFRLARLSSENPNPQ